MKKTIFRTMLLAFGASRGEEAAAGTPPDIAILPQPGMMQNFAESGFIKPLSEKVVAKINENYASVWKDLGSYKGQTYGVFHRVNAKSFVWYNKKEWEKKRLLHS